MRWEKDPMRVASDAEHDSCDDAGREDRVSATPQTASENEDQKSENESKDKELTLEETPGACEEEEEEEEMRLWICDKIREVAGFVVNNTRFQLLVILLIVINGAMMGIATFSFVSDDPDVASAFETVDLVFLVIFTVELVMQFIYHRLHLFTDGWLIFDFIIIIMSWSLSSMQIVRVFRVFRVFRLVTRVKVLKDLVSALFSVAPRMTAIFMLLMLIFYIYAVMCTVLFKDMYANGHTEYDYFSTLDKTLWTLLIMMTLDWAFVSRQIMAVVPYAWVIFVSFVMITSFIAYNLIIAVVCDSVSIIEMQNKEDEAREEAEEGENSDDDDDTSHARRCRIRKLSQRVEDLTKQQHVVLKMLQEVVEANTKVERRLSSPS